MIDVKTIIGLLEPKHRRQALFTVVVMIGMSLLEIVGIGAIFPLMAVLADPERVNSLPVVSDVYGVLQPIDNASFIVLMAVAIAGLFVVKVLAAGLSYRWQFRFAYDVQRTLMIRLLRTYLLAPYQFYLNKNTADLLKNIQSEIPALANGALIPSLQVVGEIIVLTAILILLVLVNPLLTGMVILIVAVLVPSVLWVTKRRTEKFAAQRRITIGEMYRTASSALGGFKDLKVLGRQQYFVAAYEQATRSYCESNAYIMLMGQIPRLVLELVLFTGIVSVLAYAAYWTGDVRNALPLIALYGVAAARSLPSLNKIIAGTIQIRYYRGLLELFPRMVAESKTWDYTETEEALAALTLQREICISKLSFQYPESDRKALDDVSLTIPRGTTVAFVGPSGAGKTTLADVILGLLDGYDGEIRIDDTLLTQGNVRGWRQRVGYVPQTVFLADDSMLGNIAFGVPPSQVDRRAVERAIQIAQLTELVAQLPQGLETSIGERGIRLSGGQRQRIGIARALYGNPDVLIFDEATSALDGLTEQEIGQEIQMLAGQKTIIVIAHRLSTIRQCNTVVLLESGKITATGSYDDLVRSNNYFARASSQR